MVGTDIIEVARIEKLIKEKGNKFLNKIFSDEEIEYCESKGPNKYQHYAGRFAAKEALYKVDAHFFNLIPYKSIEILTEPDLGKPLVFIPDKFFGPIHIAFLAKRCGYNNANDYDGNRHSTKIFNVSISHIKEYAIAVATTNLND